MKKLILSILAAASLVAGNVQAMPPQFTQPFVWFLDSAYAVDNGNGGDTLTFTAHGWGKFVLYGIRADGTFDLIDQGVVTPNAHTWTENTATHYAQYYWLWLSMEGNFNPNK